MTGAIQTAANVAQKFALLDDKAQEFVMGYVLGYQAHKEAKKEDTQK